MQIENKKITFIVLVSLVGFLSAFTSAETQTVASPDGLLVVNISDDGGAPSYQATYRGLEIIKKSLLGLEFKNANGFVYDLKMIKAKKSSADSTWEQPWGEQRLIRDNHNELLVSFTGITNTKKSIAIRIRIFDDGFGFRYEVPTQAGLASDKAGIIEIIDEKTQFVIPDADKTTAWWIPGRAPVVDEYLYNTTALTDVIRAQTPLTMKLPSGIYLSIHEAALIDYAAFSIDRRLDGILKAELTPWSDGVRVKLKGAFKTPWRTVQVSPDAAGLLNSHIILNLNEPNVLGDVSWVKPGKYIGIWWGMHIGKYTWGAGPQHGATTEETKRYMDFAAKYGFSGVLVEGWNEGWSGETYSFTKAYPDFDMAEITRYGDAKKVKLIGHHETFGAASLYHDQMGAALDLYKKYGVEQVKTGYVADHEKIKRTDEHGIERNEWHDGQFMVDEYLLSVTEAAKRKISIDTHEPIKDTGLRRTYPNWITREGARGQEFNAWGAPPNLPEHMVMLPFTRMLAGPMDYTPGIFNLAPKGLEAESRVRGTLAKELALYVVIYSPIQMAADIIENYTEADGKTIKPAFQFIIDVPTDWEESRALAGAVGDYVVIARKQRNAQDWYLGAITDENAREVNINLDFLDANKHYEAQIYRDGDKAEWRLNPYDMVIEKKSVTAKDALKFKLGTSGGVAIRFKAL